MTTNPERWRQRLQNLNSAYEHLRVACLQETYNKLEEAGLIQTFEFTFELAWKAMKDRLEFEGYELRSPRETIRRAFEMNLIDDADPWLKALESRNLFNHTYNDELAKEAIALVKNTLEPMLRQCVERLNGLTEKP